MKQRKPARAPMAALLLTVGAVLAAAPVADAATTLPARSPAQSPAQSPAPIPALERGAYALRSTEVQGDLDDLRPVGRMVNDARVVGLGEATHSSHEFFTMKQRVFRYLVEEKGFRSFALEASWSTGLRLNDYVVRGQGDPEQIMREEFQALYVFWNNSEYLNLLRWMRTYNLQHPQDPVQFMGDDFGYAGPQLYDDVTAYVARARPELLSRFTELYDGLRPTATAEAHMKEYPERPLAERQEIAGRTGRALALLKQQRPGTGGDARAYAWAVQHATAIDQTARGYSFDFDNPQQGAEGMRYRDRIMADNVDWWQKQTGDKVLLAAHNGHVALQSHDPAHYPKVQGSYLRDTLGKNYVSIGSTFDQGSFNAYGDDGRLRTHTVGSAGPGTNEYTLDEVRLRDYVLDLRNAPPAARDWLAMPRPTRHIGGAYPGPAGPEARIALAASYDVLIHLHQVTAAHQRPAPTEK
ncbi:erythromycin esterase family protein [Streptomyces sp. NBC_00536]|uniref:erythromycin esterase family protein n=1 Tax=Streptomyces sp. NBC_00536 TaxID=2975769 RepID=UPI002E821A1B|nr:erythromycin esterase family protein [Streptomyces sp. NBC_00536]WUC77324.1 erythromycin esterase family protein [Streptomyces sp. NBC_00536]